ncbi:MAG: hypothetical protein ACJA0X_001708 [Cyclobacteriaceae bacterium]|jgi:hypothetical protein
MEIVYDLLKITLPAGIVLYAVYLVIRAFLNNQLDEYKFSLSQKNQEIILPIRLQAYERVCLLLERVSPGNIIPRLNENGMNARQFQADLVIEIRKELNHNLSQQVYLSNDAWAYVSGAIEQLISMINEAGNQLTEEASSLDLARLIFEKSMQQETDVIKNAIGAVKREIQQLF